MQNEELREFGEKNDGGRYNRVREAGEFGSLASLASPHPRTRRHQGTTQYSLCDFISSCSAKSLWCGSLRFSLEVSLVDIFLSVGKTEVPEAWWGGGRRRKSGSVTGAVL